jgi:hypothetical protein
MSLVSYLRTGFFVLLLAFLCGGISQQVFANHVTSTTGGPTSTTGGASTTDGTATEYGFTVNIKNPLENSGIDSIEGFIEKIIDIIVMIVTPFIVLCLIYAGFQYVTAGGDPGKIKKAHAWLLWTVVGAAVILGAWVIAHAIAGTVKELAAPL